jgi:hypothetical protein
MAGVLPAVFHPMDGDICHCSHSFVLDPDIQDASIHEKQTDI